jgi:hypothetical protein
VAGPPAPRLGINLAAINDWNTELPFVDVFRLTRTWVSQKKGTRWGQGPKLDLDERGWIRRLEPGCSADTPLCTIQGGHYPAGDYVVLYDGRGEFSTYGAASVVSRGLGRLILRVDPRKGGFFLRLMATDPGDYVRNVRVLMPGHEKDYRDNPWNPAFLRLWYFRLYDSAAAPAPGMPPIKLMICVPAASSASQPTVVSRPGSRSRMGSPTP